MNFSSFAPPKAGNTNLHVESHLAIHENQIEEKVAPTPKSFFHLASPLVIPLFATRGPSILVIRAFPGANLPRASLPQEVVCRENCKGENQPVTKKIYIWIFAAPSASNLTKARGKHPIRNREFADSSVLGLSAWVLCCLIFFFDGCTCAAYSCLTLFTIKVSFQK